MIEVINGKQFGFIGQNKIYIGRTNKRYLLSNSVLANPFVIGKNGNRESVIKKYRVWLWNQIKTQDITNPVYKEINTIVDKVRNGVPIILTCYCKPQACHGDIIKACVEWLIKSQVNPVLTQQESL